MRAPLYAGAVAKLVRQRTANPRSPVRVRAAPLKTRSPYGAPRSLGLGASCVLEGRERRRPDARARRALAGTPKADPRTAGSSRAATLPSKTTTVIRETSEDRPQGDRSSIRAAPLRCSERPAGFPDLRAALVPRGSRRRPDGDGRRPDPGIAAGEAPKRRFDSRDRAGLEDLHADPREHRGSPSRAMPIGPERLVPT